MEKFGKTPTGQNGLRMSVSDREGPLCGMTIAPARRVCMPIFFPSPVAQWG